jgi:uncharacterized cofD-like protein
VTTQTAAVLESLLLDPSGPKVVAIGGGHGLAITLEAVQSYASSVTAVVAVADDGGSSGRLTSGLGIPPPGDIRRCLLALTPEPSMWSELFAYRFHGGDIEDHSLGNLLLAALTDLLGDFAAAVDAAGRMLGAVGNVIPAAAEPAILSATVGGVEVVGQAAISKAQGGIERLEVGPSDLRAHPQALQAIAGADQIVLGPGSLYTSLLAVLMVPWMAEAVMASPARKAFVLNLVTQDGETLGLSGDRHVQALAELGGITGPGVIVTNDGLLDVPPSVEPVWVRDQGRWGWSVVAADIADHTADWPAHDPMRLGWTLAELVGSGEG